MTKQKFTTSEIKNWLEGHSLTDENNKVITSLHLRNIIDLVEDEQDGIAACIERDKV